MLSRKLLPVLAPCRGAYATKAGTPKLMQATIDAYGDKATCLVQKDAFTFLVEEPPKLGGRGMGPNPLTVLLGSLTGCTQYTLTMISKEKKVPLGKFSWKASGEYDLNGVRGVGEQDARFQSINCESVVETEASQEQLDEMAKLVESRCIVAATLKASGCQMSLAVKKGDIDVNQDTVKQFEQLTSNSETGQVTKDPGSQADSPQFVGNGGGRRSARSYHTSVWLSKEEDKNLRTSEEEYGGKDGEEVSREHLHAETEPQIQKETSEKGVSRTAGGAYAARDDPLAQAAQPTEGKSDKQVIEEQSAGATTHPDGKEDQTGGGTTSPGGSSGLQTPSEDDATPPGFAGEPSPWSE